MSVTIAFIRFISAAPDPLFFFDFLLGEDDLIGDGGGEESSKVLLVLVMMLGMSCWVLIWEESAT